MIANQLNGTLEEIAAVKQLYAQHANMPYISPKRDLKQWLSEVSTQSGKLVPKRNMEVLENGLLPGHIIILWRVQFGTYTNETVISKYFEYSYGIDAKSDIEMLIEKGYVVQKNALDSINHVTSGFLKAALKQKNIAGLSKMKRDDIDEAIKQHLSEEELDKLFSIREYGLTVLGEQALAANQQVIDKHPKKKF